VSLMFMRGGRHAAGAALNRSLAIAEAHGDALDQLRLLGPLNMFYLRTGNFTTALDYARRCSAIAGTVQDSVAVGLAHAILGISLQLNGDLALARAELEAALSSEPRSRRTTTIYLGFEGKNLAGSILARTLWLQGHPAQAVERVHRTVNDAAAMHHSLTLSIALIWGISVFLWTGDLQSAEEHIDWLISHSESYSMAPYRAVGRGFKGELAIRRGDASSGVAILEECLETLHSMPYELLTTELNISLVQGLSAVGRFADGIALIDETMQRVETNGDLLYLSELLRVKGDLLLSMSRARAGEAEMHLLKSLELSRRQDARGWELRAATDLAALLAGQGRPESGRALLQPVRAQFVEGSETADLKAADGLLASLA
jgi:tetratricopeptide (TPR) repeat protein